MIIECRVQYTYAHVDKLYKNADKIQVWRMHILLQSFIGLQMSHIRNTASLAYTID